MEDKDPLDRLIDEGVREFVNAEPPLGMDQRVIAAVEQKRHRAWWRSPWLIAAPALAALLLVIGLALRGKGTDQVLNVARTSTQQPPQSASNASDGVSREAPPRSIAKAGDAASQAQNVRCSNAILTAAASKPPRFPSPAPLSDQEKMLVRMAAQNAPPATVAVVQPLPPYEVSVDLIQISAIQVQSLPDPNLRGQ